MSRHWSVTVEVSGERLVTIESAHLSGKAELTAEDEATICTAALHLLSFIGKPIGFYQQPVNQQSATEPKCTCPEDWQGMDHTAGCKSRASR